MTIQILRYRFTEDQIKNFNLKFEGINDPIVIDSSWLKDEEKLLELHKEVKMLEAKKKELESNYREHAKALQSLEHLFAYLNRPQRIVGQVVRD
jgi:hypothetical protein